MPRPTKVLVTARALAQRIKRRLEATDRRLVGRPGRATADASRFVLVDVRRNVVIDPAVDLHALGRQVGALAPYEALADS